jgi:hypothetical protein
MRHLEDATGEDRVSRKQTQALGCYLEVLWGVV